MEKFHSARSSIAYFLVNYYRQIVKKHKKTPRGKVFLLRGLNIYVIGGEKRDYFYLSSTINIILNLYELYIYKL